MARRTYKRDSQGRFKGGSGGVSSAVRATRAGATKRSIAPSPSNSFKGGGQSRSSNRRAREIRALRAKRRVAGGILAAYAGTIAYQAAKEAAIGRGTARFNQDKANLKNRSGSKTLVTLSQSQFGSLPKASSKRRLSGAYKISSL